MADEAPETFSGGARATLGTFGFLLPMAGIEQLLTSNGILSVSGSVALIVIGPVLFFVPAAWNRLTALAAAEGSDTRPPPHDLRNPAPATSVLIPLNRAAEQAFASLEGTYFGDHIAEVAGFKRGFGTVSKTTEEILRLVMLNLSVHGEVTGLKWPSGKRAPVGYMRGFRIYPDENCLRHDHEDRPVYTELATTQAVIDEFVRYGKSVSASHDPHDHRAVPPPTYIPLPEVAVRVLDATLNNLIGEMAMREPTVEDRLNWYGIWIAEIKEVPLYGRRPPATKLELIPVDEVKRLRFMGGAKSLHEQYGQHKLAWADLAIKSDDLEKKWGSLLE